MRKLRLKKSDFTKGHTLQMAEPVYESSVYLEKYIS